MDVKYTALPLEDIVPNTATPKRQKNHNPILMFSIILNLLLLTCSIIGLKIYHRSALEHDSGYANPPSTYGKVFLVTIGISSNTTQQKSSPLKHAGDAFGGTRHMALWTVPRAILYGKLSCHLMGLLLSTENGRPSISGLSLCIFRATRAKVSTCSKHIINYTAL